MRANPGGTQRTAGEDPITSRQRHPAGAPAGGDAPGSAAGRSRKTGGSGRAWVSRVAWLVITLGVAAVLAACRTHYQPTTVDPQTAVDFRPGWQVGRRYLQRYETATTMAFFRAGVSPAPGPRNSRAMDVGVSVLEKLGTGGFDVEVEIVRFHAEHSLGPRGAFVFDSETDPAQDSPDPHNALYRRLGGARIRCVTDRHGRIERMTFGSELNAFLNANSPFGGQGILRTMLNEETFSEVLGLVGTLPERPLKSGESWSASRLQTTGPPVPMIIAGSRLRIDQTNTLTGFENHEGRHCAVVEVAGAISPEADGGARMGLKSVVKGKTTGKFWFDLRRGVFSESTFNRELTRETNRDNTNRVSTVTTQTSRLKLLEVRDLSAEEYARLVPTVVPTAVATKTPTTPGANLSVAVPLRAVALPGDTVDLRLKWRVGKRYLQHMEVVQEGESTISEIPKPTKQESTQSQDHWITVVKAHADGGHELELECVAQKIESKMRGLSVVRFDSTSDATTDRTDGVAAAMRKLVGLKIHYLTDVNGRIESVVGAQELRSQLTASAAPLARAILGPFLLDENLKRVVTLADSLPNQSVKIGDSWTLRRDGFMAQMGIIQTGTTNTFTGWAEHNQRHCAVIEFTGTVTNKYGVLSAMLAMSIENGKVAGKSWFDPATGMLVASFSEQEMTIKVVSAGRVSENRIKSKVSVNLTESGDIPPAN